VLTWWKSALGRGRVKVFTHPVGTYYYIELGPVAAAAKAHGVALELNASKLHKKDLLARFLERCAAEEVLVVVNSDAHMADAVGAFEGAGNLLAEVGFPERLVVNRSTESIASFFGFEW
jgi:putative hydrolase